MLELTQVDNDMKHFFFKALSIISNLIKLTLPPSQNILFYYLKLDKKLLGFK